MWIKIKEHKLGNEDQLLVGDKIKQLKGGGNQKAMGSTAPSRQPYPRNLVPGGPSCRMRLTRLSPSLRGGGAVGRWSLLIRTQQVEEIQERT